MVRLAFARMIEDGRGVRGVVTVGIALDSRNLATSGSQGYSTPYGAFPTSM